MGNGNMYVMLRMLYTYIYDDFFFYVLRNIIQDVLETEFFKKDIEKQKQNVWKNICKNEWKITFFGFESTKLLFFLKICCQQILVQIMLQNHLDFIFVLSKNPHTSRYDWNMRKKNQLLKMSGSLFCLIITLKTY